jgi:trans-aconitate 2-methyltransferase
MEWNPRQYEKFMSAREQPFDDLLAFVRPAPRMRVVDLGCGLGNLTHKIAGAFPDSTVLGIDSSAKMLEPAKPSDRVTFEVATIEDFAAASGEDFDLVFSNAALHWVADHARLVPRLWSRLRPGGQLAVQIPADDFNPARLILAEVAGWRHQMGNLDTAEYADLLYTLGAEHMVVMEKIYPHVLDGADAVLEWAKGTALLPYLAKLPQSEHAAFVEEVRRKLHARYPQKPVFFPFRRVLFYGRRAA